MNSTNCQTELRYFAILLRFPVVGVLDFQAYSKIHATRSILSETHFIEFARFPDTSPWRIKLRRLFPNITALFIVIFSITIIYYFASVLRIGYIF